MGLCNEDLQALAERGVEVPAYDRSKVTAGIVHIGASHFARGHLLKYFDDILKNDLRWGVKAIDIRSASRREALAKQDYLYSVTERGVDGTKQRIIGSLIDVTVAQENPQTALDVLCDPEVKLVTITVTQQGYGHNPTTGKLDFERADIKECLSSMDDPSTTVGYLVTAIERRMKDGAPPLTIMSCDNMPANGTILRNVVLDYATERSAELREYIERNITFPSTMVDRIVPTTNQTDVFNTQSSGIDDSWPILTESFMQWVIEDDFAGDVPNFSAAGATVTKDVEPFELMKLRMLNGAHMALGCVAGLAGHKFVDEAMQDPELKAFIKGFMDEAASTLPPIPGVDIADYEQQLISRLENPHMKDELVRLARNGTQKMNGRILDTLIDARAKGQPNEHLTFTTAAWIQYLKGTNDQGSTIEINDDGAVESGLQNVAINSNANPIPAMRRSELFDRSLMSDQTFLDRVSEHLHRIQEHGVVKAAAMIGNQSQPAQQLTLVKG